jgi:hypothetical protein
MADVIYNYFKKAVMQGTYKLDNTSTPLYLALVNNSYSPNIDTEFFLGQFIGTYQITGTGYVSGGLALSSPNIQLDTTKDAGVLYATNIAWYSATFTAKGGVLYASTGGGFASDPVIGYFDFAADKTVTAGTFTVQFNANGVLNMT